MKTFTVELPEKLATEIENYVKSGWFRDEAEVMRIALQEFIHYHRVRLMEKCIEDDIEWALKIKKA